MYVCIYIHIYNIYIIYNICNIYIYKIYKKIIIIFIYIIYIYKKTVEEEKDSKTQTLAFFRKKSFKRIKKG